MNFTQDSRSPYHVTARSLNREWFAVPMEEVWEIAQNLLYFATHAFGVETHAFVLMMNHYHWLLTAPLGNLSEMMAYFQREWSREIGRRAGRINTIWGGRFHRSRIDTDIYLQHAYKYIYLNPVKAGVCQRVEDYQYSSLNGVLGSQKLVFPVFDPMEIASGLGSVESTLGWLNRIPGEEQWDQVRRALKRKVFEIPKVDSRHSSLDNDAL